MKKTLEDAYMLLSLPSSAAPQDIALAPTLASPPPTYPLSRFSLGMGGSAHVHYIRPRVGGGLGRAWWRRDWSTE
eukprot:scaffold216648_cov26-Tisochrysis_lutea.AAC.1